MEKIVCPNCEKEIDKQNDLKIPMTELIPSPPYPLSEVTPTTESGVSEVSLIHKEGNYYLVFETICICPYCETQFELDLFVNVKLKP